MHLGIFKIVFLASSPDRVRKNINPPEVLARTLIPSPRPLKNPRTMRRARYRLIVLKGKLPDLPSGGVQTFTRGDKTRGVVRINLDGVGANQPRTKKRRTRLVPRVKHSAMINGRDPLIRRLARRAVRGIGTDEKKRAEAMRRFVYRFIKKKDLGVGFASASQTARSARGDCTEHAVLLAALLRADGRPARIVSGLVYVPEFLGKKNVFVYHMWTQVYLASEGRWRDLDSALGVGSPFDAAHITLAVSDLDTGTEDDFLGELYELYGNLRIEVLSERPSGS